MPGTNLTREEAATRAALVTVDTPRRRARRHHRPRDLLDPQHDPVHAARQPGRRDLPRLRRRHRRGGHASTAPTSTRPSHYADSRVRLPGLAAENVVVVTATGRYTNTGEGLHRFVDPVDDEVYLYSQFEVPGQPADVPRVRAARPQGRASPSRSPRRPTGRSSPTPRRPQPDARPARAPPRGTSPRHRADLELHHRARRRPLRRRARHRHEPPRRGAARHLLPQVADPLPRRRQPLRPHQARLRVLRGGVRLRLPVREVRPALHAGVQHGRDGERRLRDDQRDVRLPVQGHRVHRRAARPDRAPRAGPHVVRQPRDDALVERPVAQRVLRRVGLHDLPVRGHPLDRRLDHLRHPREGLGLPPGPALVDPPDRRRDPRPARTSRSTSTASPTPRAPRCSSSSSPTSGASRSATACAPTSPSTPWGNTTLDDLLVRARGHLRPRPAHLVARSGSRPPGSAPCARSLEVDDRGRIASAAIEQTCAPGFETLRPHTARASGCTPSATARCTAPTASSSTSTASAPRCPSSSGASSPTCCSSTTTTSPTPRSGSTSARSPPRWRTRAASRRSLPRALVLASLWDMTRDAEMGARHFVDVVLETLPGETDSTLLRTLITQLQTAVHSYTAPEHREAVRRRDPRPALGARPGRRARQRRPAAARQRRRAP